jgi:uncharacterized protein YndB with AHSA1/START domain
MARSIQHQFFFPHPPQLVWEYLTTAELISDWLMENDFQPILGHEFQFRTKPLPSFDFDGIVYCKVLEIVPLKRLSYSWKGGPAKGQITLDSVVQWTLAEKDKGTELSLLHSGFPDEEGVTIYSIMNEGWLKHMQRINERINAATHDTTHS